METMTAKALEEKKAYYREYYKNKVKGELPDGSVKPVRFVKRSEATDAR